MSLDPDPARTALYAWCAKTAAASRPKLSSSSSAHAAYRGEAQQEIGAAASPATHAVTTSQPQSVVLSMPPPRPVRNGQAKPTSSPAPRSLLSIAANSQDVQSEVPPRRTTSSTPLFERPRPVQTAEIPASRSPVGHIPCPDPPPPPPKQPAQAHARRDQTRKQPPKHPLALGSVPVATTSGRRYGEVPPEVIRGRNAPRANIPQPTTAIGPRASVPAVDTSPVQISVPHSDVSLTREQRHILDLALSGESMFFTGPAGAYHFNSCISFIESFRIRKVCPSSGNYSCALGAT